MGAPTSSQIDPLPSNLPFKLVSKTIGAGAYASIRKAVPLGKSHPVIAIKFINKAHAVRHGRLSPSQIKFEISLHEKVCSSKTITHPNIIRLLHYGDDPAWYWLALELAEGGDLFDKIEADEGVPEDVAHFYFHQLIDAIAWCHQQGVAHRDIKPENMLLSSEGNLKLADFGLATAYIEPRTRQLKQCTTVCGSPPYIAPEILKTGMQNMARKKNPSLEKATYLPAIADLWSCAIVLFVLLVGNTPWDQPLEDRSQEYWDFLQTNGRPNDELWENIPKQALSLIRGMLRVDPTSRFTFTEIRTHPWYTRPNPYLSSENTSLDSVALATTMIERLHIDMSPPDSSSQTRRIATMTQATYNASLPTEAILHPQSQPESVISDTLFEWEPTIDRLLSHPASQPLTTADLSCAAAYTSDVAAAARHLLDTDVSLSQFTSTQGLPLTLTQAARRFTDIAPSHALTRFYSTAPRAHLVSTLRAGLTALGMSSVIKASSDDADSHYHDGDAAVAGRVNAGRAFTVLYISGTDGRGQVLNGQVFVECTSAGGGFSEVRMNKARGDPVEWRRLFKALVRGCRDVVFVPGVVEGTA